MVRREPIKPDLFEHINGLNTCDSRYLINQKNNK